MGKKSKGKVAAKRQKEKRSRRVQALTGEERNAQAKRIEESEQGIRNKVRAEQADFRAEREARIQEVDAIRRQLEENQRHVQQMKAQKRQLEESQSLVLELVRQMNAETLQLEENEQRQREENESRARELVQQMNTESRQLEERSRQFLRLVQEEAAAHYDGGELASIL